MMRISEKDPRTMTAGEINRELDRLDKADRALGDEMIREGRGHERPSEYLKKDDPLSRKLQAIFDRSYKLRFEIEARYGPGAPSRLPIRTGRRAFGPRKNPETDTKEAERLYRIFHQFEPRKVGAFASGFSIPRRATHVGEAKTMYYTSDKLNPTTGEDEGAQRYYHPHEGDVYMLVTDKGAQGHVVEVPRWIHGVGSLVLLGQCDGFEYEDFDGDLQEAQATGRKPEWYCIPSGKALLVVQDKKKVLAIVYGGSLDVEWRGVVG